MLRVSKLADYATLIMAYLARNVDKLKNARDIADATNLTMPTVSKLLKRLSKADLLTSERGANGGYKLCKSVNEISLADIIYALEENRGLTECSYHAEACSLHNVCLMQNNWRLVSQTIDSVLTSVSLRDFINPNLQIDYKFGVICGE